MQTLPNINGQSVIARRKDVIFIRLPRSMWRSVGRCDCPHCQGREGFWDTLAVSATAPERNDTVWTVHMPENGHAIEIK